MNKINVLLCEDEALTQLEEQEAIEAALAQSGRPYEVKGYFNGLGALEYLRGQGHARDTILVTDGSMPKLDGSELLRTLDNENLLPEHIIVCSSMEKDDFSNKVGDLKHPVSFEFLPKPGTRALSGYIARASRELARQASVSARQHFNFRGLTR